MGLFLLGAAIFVVTAIAKGIREKENGSGIFVLVVVGLLILSAIIAMFESGSGSSKSHTDGVFESATEKMDKGVPLNDREKQRVNDILNYKENERAKEIENHNGER